MSVARTRKEKVRADLARELACSRCVVLADFTGIDVAGMTRLRREMKSAGVGFRVVKNTVLRRAFVEANVPPDAAVTGLAEGPTAVAWAVDEILPVRALKKFASSNEGRPGIKGGYVSGQSMSASEMMSLADLPGREELVARIMGSMNAPLQGFVNVTGAVLRGFLNAVNGLREKREQQG